MIYLCLNNCTRLEEGEYDTLPLVFLLLAHFLVLCEFAAYFLCHGIFSFHSNLRNIYKQYVY